MADETKLQAVEGYLCVCGFKTSDKGTFTGHIVNKSKHDTTQKHESLGRVNMETGEITMPKYVDRTDEQKAISKNARKGKGKGIGGETTSKQTDDPSIASEIRFVPRVYTADYSPIMRSAQAAAVREWKWRADMPLGNFLDTIIYNFFFEHGIRLASYVVETTDDEDDSRNNGHKEIEDENKGEE